MANKLPESEVLLEPPFKHALHPVADEKYFNIARPLSNQQNVGKLPDNFKHGPIVNLSEFDTDVPALRYLSKDELQELADRYTTTYQKYYHSHPSMNKMMSFEKVASKQRKVWPECYLLDRPQTLFPKVNINQNESDMAIAARLLASQYKTPEEIRAAQINWGKFLRENPARAQLGEKNIIPQEQDYHYNGSHIVHMPKELRNYRMRLRDMPSAHSCYKLQPIDMDILQTYRKTSPYQIQNQKSAPNNQMKCPYTGIDRLYKKIHK